MPRGNVQWMVALLLLNLACTQKEFSGQVNGEIESEITIEALRTPDENFASLEDFAYTPHYITVEGKLRMHYLDENNSGDNQVIVLLHGEPSWSYLYRDMIPYFVDAGFRVIVPDMIGFGKSDKPVHPEDHTYQRHVNWMRTLLFDSLKLHAINLFAQDWGGLIGLRLVAENPGQFNTVIASNTGLPTGEEIPGEAFLAFQEYSQSLDPFPVSTIIQKGTEKILSDSEMAAYDAPFPDESYKAAVKVFPLLVPTNSQNPATMANKAAWKELKRFNKPFLTIFSADDPLTIGWRKSLQENIPGAAGQPHVILSNARHFIQEDKGEEVALRVISFIANANQ